MYKSNFMWDVEKAERIEEIDVSVVIRLPTGCSFKRLSSLSGSRYYTEAGPWCSTDFAKRGNASSDM